MCDKNTCFMCGKELSEPIILPNKDDFKMMTRYNGGYDLRIENNKLSIWCGDECESVFEVGYCPICGSKLNKN